MPDKSAGGTPASGQHRVTAIADIWSKKAWRVRSDASRHHALTDAHSGTALPRPSAENLRGAARTFSKRTGAGSGRTNLWRAALLSDELLEVIIDFRCLCEELGG